MIDWWAGSVGFHKVRAAAGIVVILGLAVLFSANRRAISKRVVFGGIGLQFLLGVLLIYFEPGQRAMQAAGQFFAEVLSSALSGAAFLFGETLVLDPKGVGIGFVFAFRVLSTVIFMAALFAVLYHLGIMQVFVRAFAWFMARLMRVSGAESLNTAASVFLGQTEAPLTIRPYLSSLTRSELLTVMVAGMATVSGSVMIAYFDVGASPAHILTASLMAAPAAIVLSKILLPETETPLTLGTVREPRDESLADANLLDAIARGTRDGLHLALNIGAMLIAFLGLIALVNKGLAFCGTSLESILGRIFAPVAYLLGVPWEHSPEVGGLLGSRMVANEIVAYVQLQDVRKVIDPRSDAIATFALCGFANLSSIGIQIGGIGALAPDRRKDLAELGVRALFAATLANFLSACIAGILL